MKRLFIGLAIEINAELREALKRVRISAQQKEMEVEWSLEAGLHITLCFLGATPEETIPLLTHALSTIVTGREPVETSLRGMGAFPDDHHSRTLWVGIRNSRTLRELQQSVAQAMAELGFPLEEREYTPHMTFARLRKARTSRDLLSPYVRRDFGDVKIDHLLLYESLRHGAKSVYQPLEKFQF